MSAQTKKVEQASADQDKVQRVEVREVIEKPVALSGDRISDNTATGPRELGEFFVVPFVSRSGLPDSLTFHRPLGCHNLSPGAWVCTPTKDVHTLLDGLRDPSEGELTRKENIVLNELWITHGLLEKGTDGDLLYVKLKISRKASLEGAEKSLKEAIAKLRAEHDAKQSSKKGKKAVFRHNLALSNFLAENVKEEERKLAEFRRKHVDELRQRVPRSFETRSGVFRDVPQVAVPYIRDGATTSEARLAAFQRLYRLSTMAEVDTSDKAVLTETEKDRRIKKLEEDLLFEKTVNKTNTQHLRLAEDKAKKNELLLGQVRDEFKQIAAQSATTPKRETFFGSLFKSRDKPSSLNTLDDFDVVIENIKASGNTPLTHEDLRYLVGDSEAQTLYDASKSPVLGEDGKPLVHKPALLTILEGRRKTLAKKIAKSS